MQTLALTSVVPAFLAALLLFAALVVATYALSLARSVRVLASRAARADSGLRETLRVIRLEMDEVGFRIHGLGRVRRRGP